MSTDTAQQLAVALTADGFVPPPAVGQLWLDLDWKHVTGETVWVQLTSISRTAGVWHATAKRLCGSLTDPVFLEETELPLASLVASYQLLVDVSGAL